MNCDLCVNFLLLSDLMLVFNFQGLLFGQLNSIPRLIHT